MPLAIEHVELFVDIEVERENAGANDSIAPDVAKRARRLFDKSCGVVPEGWRWIRLIGANAGGVRTIVAVAGAGTVYAADRNSLRKAALNGPNRSGLPTTYDAVKKNVVNIKCSSAADGQIV